MRDFPKKMDGEGRNTKRYLAAAAVSAFFIFTMCYQLMHSGLWGDEWVEYTVSMQSIRDGSMFASVRETYQPPLYNIVMHFWLSVNTSLLWFRSFNIAAGIASGIFMFLTVRRLCGFRSALYALTALACCYRWIYCIQECSEYALMLTFLSGALYFYVRAYEDGKTTDCLMMVLFCVAAIYTQYGAAFAAVPMLSIYFISVFLRRDILLRRKAAAAVIYGSAAVFGAVPLMRNYLFAQMMRNELLEKPHPDWRRMLGDIPTALGKILGYFYAADKAEALYTIYTVLGIVILAAAVLLVVNKKEEPLARSLALILLLCYLLHVAAVVSEIYGVTHPGNVKGYPSRYSYFYMQLFVVVFPVLASFIFKNIAERVKRPAALFLGAAGGVLLFISLYYLSFNWEKALDDRFADIWYERGGMQEVTFLTGRPHTGAEYYITHHEGYRKGDMDLVMTSISIEELPDSFYIWDTNWGGEMLEPLLESAADRGYRTEYLLQGGEYGDSLIYCSRVLN